MEITDLGAHALSRAIHRRELSCRDVMQATLARIERVNPVHNAIVSLRDGDALLAQADACDAQLKPGAAPAHQLGSMHGMPQAIKDAAHTAGIRSTFGSPLLRDFVPTQDGLMVQRMKAAGCIVIGKTNTPEFGLGSHTFNEVFGVTRNAYDPTQVGRRQQRRCGRGPGHAHAARWPTAATSWAACATRRPGTTSSACARARGGCRCGRHRTSGSPSSAPRDRWRAACAIWRCCWTCRPGTTRACRCRLPAGERFAAALDDVDGRQVRIGWLGDLGGHLPIESGVLETCEQGLERLQACGCAVEPLRPGFNAEEVWQTWLVWRRWLVAARIAPYLAEAQNRVADQGRGPVGA